MADVEFSRNPGAYGHDMGEPGAPNSLVTATNIAGAVVSLALIAGISVWGYKLMVRDVSGVPVVRAAQGDMRVRPENPGGQLARNQGLAVNEVAAEGLAAGPVDQVILAPRALTLTDEDQPVISRAAEPPLPVSPPDETAREAVPDINERLRQGEIDAVVAELTGDAVPVVQVTGAKTVTVAATPAIAEAAQAQPVPVAAQIEPTSVAIDTSGLRSSIRPRLRPDDVSAMVKPAAYTPAAPKAEIDPAAIPSGTRLVQLGAFDDPDVARAEWTRLESRFGTYLQDKSRVVQQAQSGGRTFYRLRAMGFVDLSDARRFCSAFKAEGVDCIPVQVK